MTHLVYLPDRSSPRFFLWGVPQAASALDARGAPDTAWVVDDTLRPRAIEGVAVPLLEALPVLAAMTGEDIERAPASVAVWSLAAKLALDLVSRERLVPRVVTAGGKTEARFAVALAAPEDAERVTTLAKAFSIAAHAVPVDGGKHGAGRTPRSTGGRRTRTVAATDVWAPDALLRAFLDATADGLVRAAAGPQHAAAQTPSKRATVAPWERRFLAALTGSDPTFTPVGFQERTLLADLEAWADPALGADAGVPRGCLRLDLPADGDGRAPRPHARRTARSDDMFALRFFLQAADDPSLLVPARDIWTSPASHLRRLGRAFRAPDEQLLRALAVAARLFPPVERSLREARPETLLLDAAEAWTFLTEAAPALAEAGLGVIVPTELTRSGQRRLRLRMRLGTGSTATAGVVASAGGLGLEELVSFQWQAALGGEELSARDLQALAQLKAPLVRFRGQWVALDPTELKEVERLLSTGGGTLAAHEALAAALGGAARHAGTTVPIDVAVEGHFAAVTERLRHAPTSSETVVPHGLNGTLRPYQERGLAWLLQMADLGLGACLADDMGLGKTIQLLAFLLCRRQLRPDDRRPALLVCPTSVVGNWEREIARFAPTLVVVRHYGAGRARSAAELMESRDAVVLTTYGLLRRDADVLAAADWSLAALDEAQNIKNAAARTARAARALHAAWRVALTGTPVENRLAELWSISEYLNPRLLGPLEAFRREYAIPIERYQRDDVAEVLRRVVRPFILRRLKSDPAIIHDLPPKQEMKVVCTLTREQATLYQAAVDEAMRKIESSDGIQRRGLVLALITALKQICNHPAQYLGEAGPLAGRSGKLARLCEMLEEVVAAGDRALVFTQFREMGRRLVAELERLLGTSVPFLHGGVARAARDAMVQRFQEDARGPQIFVLSVKAGGTGLNLTAASHVFHFDRWWNPAVEDQATDRAYRIGQRQAVQVHKLLCAGTVEEKVDRMLEQKRDLASRIVGAGEQWVTELDDGALRQLFALAPDAVIAGEDTDGAAEDDAECLEESATPPARRRRGRAGRSPVGVAP